MIREKVAGSRCTRCARVVVPPAAYCPDDGTSMAPATLAGVGELVSFTTLHSPPEGFRSPLHIAVVALDGGARLFCHGEDTRGLKIGSRVAVEEVNSVFYFQHLGLADRARLFWRRAGARGDKAASMGKSLAKRLWKGTTRGTS